MTDFAQLMARRGPSHEVKDRGGLTQVPLLVVGFLARAGGLGAEGVPEGGVGVGD